MTAWIGLTGGIGSGKSSAAAEFVRLGIPLVDADAISRSLTADGGAALPSIRAVFGDSVFREERLDRAALRQSVFQYPAKRMQLEAVLFPLINQEIRRRQGEYTDAVYGVIEIPLLIEQPSFAALVQRILVIDVPQQVQIDRVKNRSDLDEDEIRRIMAAQADRRQRRFRADDILCNHGSLLELQTKIGRLHRFYRAYFSIQHGQTA